MRADLVANDYAKRAGNDTVATTVADILLHIDRVKLCADNRASRACFLAGCIGTVLAHVAAHQPAVGTEEGQGCSWRSLRNNTGPPGLVDAILKEW